MAFHIGAILKKMSSGGAAIITFKFEHKQFQKLIEVSQIESSFGRKHNNKVQ